MLSLHQRWDPLKACVVGRCYPPEFFSYIKNHKVRNTFETIAQQTEEDYLKLISKLESFGVKVVRTDISDDLEIYLEQGKPPVPPMCPRDYLATIGDKFYMPSENYGDNIDVDQFVKEFVRGDYNVVFNRFKEFPEIKEYITDLFLPGRPISDESAVSLIKKLAADSRGCLAGSLIHSEDRKNLEQLILQSQTLTIGSNENFPNFKGFYAFKSTRDYVKSQGNDIIYDEYVNGGQILSMGVDLLFGLNNIINKVNENAYLNRWKKKFPGNRLNLVDAPGHIDGRISPVTPGLVIMQEGLSVRHDFAGWDVLKIPSPRSIEPKFFANKKKVRGRYWVPGEEYNDEFNDYLDEWMGHWVTYVQETAFDLNILVIDEKNVLCNNENEEVFKAFERHGVTPHVVNFRHRFFWDGGLHCITTDIDRDGEQKDYFPD